MILQRKSSQKSIEIDTVKLDLTNINSRAEDIAIKEEIFALYF